MTKFLIPMERECFVCHSPYVELHHVFEGVGRRKHSDEDGCVVYLCPEHHRGNRGVHHNRQLDLILKQTFQERWEEVYGTREEFIKRFTRSYL